MGVEQQIIELAQKAKEASRELSSISSVAKNRALESIAKAILDQENSIRTENEKDLATGKENGLSDAMRDRLALTHERVKAMADGLLEIAALPDPVGEINNMKVRPNGLRVGRMKIPLGVIGIIYESRPNVTVDAGALCLKSGNAVILRGGSEAINSNKVLGDIMVECAVKESIPEGAIQVVPMTDREAVDVLLAQEEYIDLIIPRGGESLIRAVVDKSKIPVLKHYKGVCHVFVDADAIPKKARDIVLNSKLQRTGVCNSMETLLIHISIAEDFLAMIIPALIKRGCEVRGCHNTKMIVPGVKAAEEEDWYTEYLDKILSIRIVENIEMAINHINKYGSNHTDSIVTENYSSSQKFIREVDSSSVMVNASTRFSDGFQYGLGAEIGISTTKLHAYGPMGLEELTTKKFVVFGDGHIRES
jgi:glutamate-5-semialdehyde dehydrogenase